MLAERDWQCYGDDFKVDLYLTKEDVVALENAKAGILPNEGNKQDCMILCQLIDRIIAEIVDKPDARYSLKDGILQ